jgi:hypothetical protein
MIAVVLPWICYIAQAQTDTTLKPTDKFGIPEYNSSISFATSGNYERASLENGTWNFVNLRLNNSQLLEKLTLRVSAQDSNVTIRSYQTSNTTSGWRVRLRYIVTGRGSQTFNFGLDPIGGEWDVIFNGVYKGENDGWRVSPDGTLVITAATANVTIAYYGSPDSLGDNGNSSNQPVYQQHSVAIITAVAVAITVILTIAIRRKNNEHLSQNEY